MKSFKMVLILALSMLLAVTFIGCKKDPDSGVAATVGSTEILEKDVTARIELLRVDQNTGELMDDTAWATMLKDNNFTPESLREYVIRNNFAIYDLILQKAAALNIYPDTAKVDEQIEQAKSSVESSSGTFEDYLKPLGLGSEDAYRHILEAQSVAPALVEEAIKDKQPTQTEIDKYISENAASYLGKSLSIIYYGTDTEDNTEDVIRPKVEAALAAIQDGTSFDDVVEDASLSATGGDLGFGYETSLPQEVQDAIKDLERDQVSEIIEIRTPQTASSDTDTENSASDPSSEEDAEGTQSETATETLPDQVTFWIVKWTDDFVVPEPAEGTEIQYSDSGLQIVDVSLVPEEIKQNLTDSYTTNYTSQAQQDYINSLIASDEIVINPMPEGLSYIVDMSLADATTEESTENNPEDQQPTSEENENPPAPTYDENGLGIADITVGTGATAQEGDSLEVHYSLYLSDGTFIESSLSSAPYPLVLGAGGVIKGWDLGLVGMKVGGKRQLTIPPELAYGSQQHQDIPANSTLVFDLELVSVNGDSTGYAGSSTE